jgi:RNA polymerase sigma-70 factor (ECF subfamily)
MSTIRDMTVSDIDRLESRIDERDVTFTLDEDTFRAFYDRTARPLWAYLSRMTGEPDLADDLLQEAYYRFLRAQVVMEDEAHRRNYLFRIATNLVRDGARRRACRPTVPAADDGEIPGDVTMASRAQSRGDVMRAMAQLRPRDRKLLWLAYAQGSSHREISATLGLRPGSIKPLLFRARQRLSAFLRGAGYAGGTHGRA